MTRTREIAQVATEFDIGAVQVSGTVCATSYYGDGSTLTNIATASDINSVSVLTSVNKAAITSINTVIANVSSTMATSISNHLPLAGGTLTGQLIGTSATFSGTVGIGTANPQGPLQVVGSDSETKFFIDDYSAIGIGTTSTSEGYNPADERYIKILSPDGDVNFGLYTYSGFEGVPFGGLWMEAYLLGDYLGGLGITDGGTEIGTGVPNNPLRFVNGSERMRIDSSGYALISGTSPITGHLIKGINASRALDVYHPYSDAEQGMVVFWSNVTSTQSVKCLIRADGDLENVNNSYGAYSDRKLKQDEILAASQWNDIKAIGELVKKFRLKDAVAADQNAPYQIGVVAQDIEAISPGLVDEVADVNNDGETVKVVKYSVLYMKAVKALGEALERIETLETRVAILEGAN